MDVRKQNPVREKGEFFKQEVPLCNQEDVVKPDDISRLYVS